MSKVIVTRIKKLQSSQGKTYANFTKLGTTVYGLSLIGHVAKQIWVYFVCEILPAE
jgi:hypothetical protein